VVAKRAVWRRLVESLLLNGGGERLHGGGSGGGQLVCILLGRHNFF
jgi:hypothetical protein